MLGTYVNNFADLQIPTAGMYPLIVTRRYDSGRPSDGPIGTGWSLSLTAHLYYAAYLLSAPSTYVYEADIVMPSGLLYRFTASGNTFTAPAGSFDTLVRNGDGTYSLTLQHTRSVYHFNADGSLASLVDDYGNSITYSYDASGRLHEVADAAGSGRFVDITWGADGRVAQLTDSAGRIWKYFYENGDGTLTSYSDPLVSADSSQRTMYYTYVQSRFGRVLSGIHDRWHRTLSVLAWYADGRLQSYTDGAYDDANPSNSTGEKYTYTYTGSSVTKGNSLGSRTYTVNSSGVANDPTRTFDATTGLVTSATGPDGSSTSYTYDARGNVASAQTSLVSFTYSYDTNFPDKIAKITPSDPSQWAGWQYTYNSPAETPSGALRSVSRVGSDNVAQTVAYYVYDTHGRVTSATDADGLITLYTYNAAGDLVSVSQAGAATTYEHDSLGRVTKVTTPRQNATSYTYDDADRVLTVVPPSPGSVPVLDFTTRFTYDQFDAATGFVNVTTTDPNGHASTNSYDALGHLVRTTDALSNVTQYAYQYNLLHTITDANSNVTSFAYNADRYRTSTVFYDGTSETYTRNSTGGVTAFTDRSGRTGTYSYDAVGRITALVYSGTGAPSVTYGYSGQNLVGTTDTRTTPAVNVSYTYDSQFRLATETEGAGVITYRYAGPAGQQVASYRVDPPTGQTGATVTANYSYDSSGRVNRITWSPVTGTFTYSYNADGQYSSIQFPNGQSRTFTYDNQGRLLALANLDTTARNLVTYTYAYDYDWTAQSYSSLGNRTSVAVTGSSALIPNGTNKYMYDAIGQLTGVTRLDGTSVNYDYDAIGNRLHTTYGGGGSLQFTYFQNAAQKNTPRLKNSGGSDLTYDANGNLLTYGYGWDAANRLVSISGGTQYQYDHEERRVSYTPPPYGAQVKYVSVGVHTVAERSTNTSRTNDYLFGPGIDEPLARSASDGSVSYFAEDGLGSIVGTTSSSGQLTRTASYDEWGSVIAGSVDFFGYAGREVTMPQSGTVWYNRERQYASNLGRFLSEDPLAGYLQLTGASIYSYVFNSPLMNVDPTGLACKDYIRRGLWTEDSHSWESGWFLKNFSNGTQAGAGYPPSQPPPNTGIPGAMSPPTPSGGNNFKVYPMDCIWEKMIRITSYWSRKVQLVRTCTCPDSQSILTYNELKVETFNQATTGVLYKTVGLFLGGVIPIPCPNPSQLGI